MDKTVTVQLGKERAYYDLIRDKFNETHRPDLFLYLLARCVKACVRYNSDGEFNNSPDNRRKGARPQEMRQRIMGASGLLRGRTKITDLDYAAVLSACAGDDLIYMDPPYQGVCGNRDTRYAPKIDHEAFCEQLADLNRRGLMYLVSYDGRTGNKRFGRELPASLDLTLIEVHAGRSSQATLLGRQHDTYESLYLSRTLAETVGCGKKAGSPPTPKNDCAGQACHARRVAGRISDEVASRNDSATQEGH